MTKKTWWGILFCSEHQGKLSIRDKLVKREKGQVEALRDTIRNSQAAQVHWDQEEKNSEDHQLLLQVQYHTNFFKWFYSD